MGFQNGVVNKQINALIKKKKKKTAPHYLVRFFLRENATVGNLEEMNGENSKTFWGHKDAEHKVEILLGGKVCFFLFFFSSSAFI